MTAYRSFSDVPRLAYDLIMDDPPWQFQNWSSAPETIDQTTPYETVGLHGLMQMPVGEIARMDCVLWLWTFGPMLRQSLELMDAWGFEFVTTGHWVKTGSKGGMAWGRGHVLRSCGEDYLIGVRRDGEPEEGRPFVLGKYGAPKIRGGSVPSVILGEVRGHSRKPEEGYAAAERLMPGARRLDLFSRENRPGWDAFGDEVGKFDEAAA